MSEKKQLQIIAGILIAELKDEGLTYDEMKSIFKEARKKLDYLKTKEIPVVYQLVEADATTNHS